MYAVQCIDLLIYLCRTRHYNATVSAKQRIFEHSYNINFAPYNLQNCDFQQITKHHGVLNLFTSQTFS